MFNKNLHCSRETKILLKGCFFLNTRIIKIQIFSNHKSKVTIAIHTKYFKNLKNSTGTVCHADMQANQFRCTQSHIV